MVAVVVDGGRVDVEDAVLRAVSTGCVELFDTVTTETTSKAIRIAPSPPPPTTTAALSCH
jgi:hypothetical protein